MKTLLLPINALFILHLSVIAADWPMAGGNPQRTNFTMDSPRPPYECVWRADFSPECVFSAQPVVADGRLFQTTLNGNIHALDANTGERIWSARLGRSIWSGAAAGTPEYGGAGLVFAASFEGIVYGLDAATGEERWRHDAGEPVSASPCLANGALFLGTRRGSMLALSAEDGALKWKTPLSWHIYSSAAWNNGRVYVMTEDMYVHALDAGTGEKLWTSRQMHGLCIREFYPVIHHGKVFAIVTPAVFHPGGSGMGMEPFVYRGLSDERREEIRVLNLEGKQPDWLMEKQEEILQYYRENPHFQTMYVFNEEDGSEPFIPVHHYYGGGLQNAWMPPTLCADGRFVSRSAIGLVLYDAEINRWTDMLMEVQGRPNDECDYVTVAGTMLFSKNFFSQNRIFDMDARQQLSFPRESGPVTVVSGLAGAWEPGTPFSRRRIGPSTEHLQALNGVSPPVIVGNRIFMMTHNQVMAAFEGQ